MSWEALATGFLKYCKADITPNTSLSSVAGGLNALSQAALERMENSAKKSSSSTASRRVDSLSHRSQTSLVESEDTQTGEDTPSLSSSPPTPPLENIAEAFNIHRPEYQSLLQQLRALTTPCLSYLFPKSSLRSSKFLADTATTTPVFCLRTLSSIDSEARLLKMPNFPQELTDELMSAIKSQFVKRTSSQMISPVSSPSRSRIPNVVDESHRTKTVSSIKHGSSASMEVDEMMMASPSKRFKAANGMAVTAIQPNHMLTAEAAHMRILQLETSQDNMRRELALLKAEIEHLKKPRNLSFA